MVTNTEMNTEFATTTHSIDETRDLAARLARHLQPGTVIGLIGTLGAGKTAWVQGLAAGLGIPVDQVTSPTFTLAVPHHGRLSLLHVDLYRLRDAAEIDELGLDDWIDDGGLLAVEWPEKFASALPPRDLQVTIEPAGTSERRIRIVAQTPRGTQALRHLA